MYGEQRACSMPNSCRACLHAQFQPLDSSSCLRRNLISQQAQCVTCSLTNFLRSYGIPGASFELANKGVHGPRMHVEGDLIKYEGINHTCCSEWGPGGTLRARSKGRQKPSWGQVGCAGPLARSYAVAQLMTTQTTGSEKERGVQRAAKNPCAPGCPCAEARSCTACCPLQALPAIFCTRSKRINSEKALVPSAEAAPELHASPAACNLPPLRPNMRPELN